MKKRSPIQIDSAIHAEFKKYCESHNFSHKEFVEETLKFAIENRLTPDNFYRPELTSSISELLNKFDSVIQDNDKNTKEIVGKIHHVINWNHSFLKTFEKGINTKLERLEKFYLLYFRMQMRQYELLKGSMLYITDDSSPDFKEIFEYHHVMLDKIIEDYFDIVGPCM